MYIFVFWFYFFSQSKKCSFPKKKTLYQNTGSIPLLSGDFESPFGMNELNLVWMGERVGSACAPNCNRAQAPDLSCLFVSAMQKVQKEKKKKQGQKKHFTSFVSWRSYSIFSTHRQSFLFVPWSGKRDDHVVTVLCCGRVQRTWMWNMGLSTL